MTHRSLLQYIDTGSLDLRQLKLSDSNTLTIHGDSQTHKGYVRLVNEDALLEHPKEKLWVVADGMGGHKRGDYASKTVINALQSFKQQGSLSHTLKDLQKRLIEANEHCQKAFRAKRIGSTVAVLFEYGGYCFFLWAGDSRIYRLREQALELMTHDHSLAQEKYANGELNQDEADNHASAHILTRAVGIHRHLKLELHCEPVRAGDRYLLCSDGVYGSIDHSQIQTHLSQHHRKEALKALTNTALDNGGRDNITAILVDFDA